MKTDFGALPEAMKISDKEFHRQYGQPCVDPDRGTGRTTKQLTEAPREALFICLDEMNVRHTRRLAESLTLPRTDLRIVSQRFLDSPQNYAGKFFTAVVVDHAVMFTPRQYDNFYYLQSRIRPSNSDKRPDSHPV